MICSENSRSRLLHYRIPVIGHYIRSRDGLSRIAVGSSSVCEYIQAIAKVSDMPSVAFTLVLHNLLTGVG